MLKTLIESITEITDNIHNLLNTYKLKVSNDKKDFINSFTEKIQDYLKQLKKEENEELQKYFMNRIHYYCNDLIKCNQEKCINLLEKQEELLKRIEELEVKNMFYKRQIGDGKLR